MNKKTSHRVKAIKLELKKDTVASLTPEMLKHVAGGAVPETRISACESACFPSC